MTHNIGESADERPAACSAAPEMGAPMDVYQCMELTSHQGSTYDDMMKPSIFLMLMRMLMMPICSHVSPISQTFVSSPNGKIALWLGFFSFSFSC